MKNLFSERLKQLREACDMTQQKLGEKLNVSHVTINRYEKGLRSPDLGTLIMLADIFRTSVDYLLGRTDEIKPYEESNGCLSYVVIPDLPEALKKEIEDFIQFVKTKNKRGLKE